MVKIQRLNVTGERTITYINYKLIKYFLIHIYLYRADIFTYLKYHFCKIQILYLDLVF